MGARSNSAGKAVSPRHQPRINPHLPTKGASGEGWRILGVDPGTARIGYGIIDVDPRFQARVVSYGIIKTEAGTPAPTRLQQIYLDLQELISHFEPDVAVVEQLFYFRNVTTAMGVAQARGVILLALVQAGLAIAEYTPLQVKSTITGHGRAEKFQVQAMVQEILGLANLPRPDDAADALALALCHRQFLQSGDTQRVVNR